MRLLRHMNLPRAAVGTLSALAAVALLIPVAGAHTTTVDSALSAPVSNNSVFAGSYVSSGATSTINGDVLSGLYLTTGAGETINGNTVAVADNTLTDDCPGSAWNYYEVYAVLEDKNGDDDEKLVCEQNIDLSDYQSQYDTCELVRNADGSVTFMWSPVDNADHYLVFGSQSEYGYGTWCGETDSDVTMFTDCPDKGLWYYTAAAYDENGHWLDDVVCGPIAVLE